MNREARDLLDALQRAADTFADLESVLRRMGKETLAEACSVAQTGARAVIASVEGKV